MRILDAEVRGKKMSNRRHAVPIPTGNSYSIRKVKAYIDQPILKQMIFDLFDQGVNVLYSSVIIREIQRQNPDMAKSTIYDNLNYMVRDEMLTMVKDGRMNIFSLSSLGKHILRTKTTGTRVTDRIRLESLRYADFLEGSDEDLHSLRTDIAHNHLGDCNQNFAMNWLQQIVQARFGGLIGFTLQFNWGNTPKVIYNVPAIWGESIEDCFNQFFTQMEFLRRRLSVELSRWNVSIGPYAHQINPHEIEQQVDVEVFDVEPSSRVRVSRRIIDEAVTEDGHVIYTPKTKEDWLDRSKKAYEAGVNISTAHDLDRALVLVNTPEYIVDLLLRMKNVEKDKQEIEQERQSLKDQTNDLTQIVLDQEKRIRALTQQIEQLTDAIKSAIGEEQTKETDDPFNDDYNPFT